MNQYETGEDKNQSTTACCSLFFCADLSTTRSSDKHRALDADKSQFGLLHDARPCAETTQHTKTNIRQMWKMFLVSWWFLLQLILIQLMVAMPIVSIPVMIAFPAALGVYWVCILTSTSIWYYTTKVLTHLLSKHFWRSPTTSYHSASPESFGYLL